MIIHRRHLPIIKSTSAPCRHSCTSKESTHTTSLTSSTLSKSLLCAAITFSSYHPCGVKCWATARVLGTVCTEGGRGGSGGTPSTLLDPDMTLSGATLLGPEATLIAATVLLGICLLNPKANPDPASDLAAIGIRIDYLVRCCGTVVHRTSRLRPGYSLGRVTSSSANLRDTRHIRRCCGRGELSQTYVVPWTDRYNDGASGEPE